MYKIKTSSELIVVNDEGVYGIFVNNNNQHAKSVS